MEPLFWLQSTKTLPARSCRVIVAVTRSGITCSNWTATFFATATAPDELAGCASGTYRCKPLLPLVTGKVFRPISASTSRMALATSASWAMPTPSPGSRSNTNRVAGPGFSPANRHCGTCTSSAACCAIHAKATEVSISG
ncbi:Uncharacterised protein [Mycobacteroides abscessus subsp. abscessus]|nr:Uncharacterised protein [Mycobacteroides abscessus subsp. abscessus]